MPNIRFDAKGHNVLAEATWYVGPYWCRPSEMAEMAGELEALRDRMREKTIWLRGATCAIDRVTSDVHKSLRDEADNKRKETTDA
jgi:hypothetical protein